MYNRITRDAEICTCELADWDDWFKVLCAYAENINPGYEKYVRSSKDAWKEYYDDGDTPKFAMDTDMSYWNSFFLSMAQQTAFTQTKLNPAAFTQNEHT
jgi:hypothetical protein